MPIPAQCTVPLNLFKDDDKAGTPCLSSSMDCAMRIDEYIHGKVSVSGFSWRIGRLHSVFFAESVLPATSQLKYKKVTFSLDN